jgi:hypothetical protein
LIDFLSIIPFELAFSMTQPEAAAESDNVMVNKFARVARVSKLYKLVKITRLIRIAKMAKYKKKIGNKMNSLIKFGAAFERLLFFLLALLLVCHLIGCLWIYVAKASQDDLIENDSWIELNGYSDMSMGGLYATSVYFTMQTLTTVGYGDISLANSSEQFMCILL